MLANTGRSKLLLTRLVEFSAIVMSFVLSCKLLSVNVQGDLLVPALIFPVIAIVSLHIGKLLQNSFVNTGIASIDLMIANAIGLLIGAVVALMVQWLDSGHRELIAVIVLATIMSFFVLGTLVPLLVSKRPTSA